MKAVKTTPIKTVLTICVGMLVVHLLTGVQWPLTVSLVVGVAGLVSERLAQLIDLLWMKLAYVLSLIMPKVMLSAVFYLVLFPVALLSRLFGGKNPLMLKDPGATTYITVNRSFDREGFEKMW